MHCVPENKFQPYRKLYYFFRYCYLLLFAVISLFHPAYSYIRIIRLNLIYNSNVHMNSAIHPYSFAFPLGWRTIAKCSREHWRTRMTKICNNEVHAAVQCSGILCIQSSRRPCLLLWGVLLWVGIFGFGVYSLRCTARPPASSNTANHLYMVCAR